MNKKKWYIVMVLVIILVVVLVAVMLYKNSMSIKEYSYKIIYRDEFTPGAKYTFYIGKNYDVTAIKEAYCTTLECIESGNTVRQSKYKVNISSKNMEVFKSFINHLFVDGKNEIELSSLYIEENDELIINVLKYNDEVFFEYYKW